MTKLLQKNNPRQQLFNSTGLQKRPQTKMSHGGFSPSAPWLIQVPGPVLGRHKHHFS